MKKILTLSILLLFGVVGAQNLDEIVKKHIEAVGGADNWNKIQSIRSEMLLKMQGAEIKIVLYQRDKTAVRQDIEAMGMTGFSIITQKEGWNFMPFQGQTKPEPLTEEELKSAQDDLNLRNEFITYKELGKTIEYLGKDDVDGMECHKIKLKEKSGKETTFFMETESLYVIKEVDKMTVNGKEFENTTMFSNFEKLPEGIVYPMSISSGWGAMDVTKIEINAKFEDALFKLPAEK